MTLRDLVWSDLFVAPDPDWCWYKPTPGSTDCIPIPVNCADELEKLRAHLASVASHDAVDLDVEWDDMELRLSIERVAGNKVLFVLRRFVLAGLNLQTTGLQSAIIATLMSDSESLKSGVVAFIGPPGAGKSTTARSFLIDRISEFGGTGWTIECPMEQRIQGRHGRGWIYQKAVKSDSEIGPQIERLYRAVPNIIMVGEIRNAQTAKEILRAAGSGYLVVVTFHGNDIIGAIRQFVDQTSRDKSESLFSSVADVLRAVIHVQLRPVPIEAGTVASRLVNKDSAGTGNPRRALVAEAIFFTDKEEQARSILRKGEYSMLTSVMESQRRKLMAGQSLA